MTTKPTMPNAWPGLMPTPKHDNAPPRADLMNPQWRYTPANKTDVRATWARHGWKPIAR